MIRTPREDTLVKMSVLARLSGVPAATIKHYLREGLLPHAEVKTSRNMAFYDPALAPRIQRIKALQREHFLPLKVIKSVLEGKPSEDDDAQAAAAIERTLESMAPHESRTRAELIASGMPEKELSFFESVGLVTAVVTGGEDTFRGDDLSLLRLLGESRRAGITPRMLPAEIIGAYVNAIGELARIELELFRKGVLPQAGEDLTKLTDVATRLSEQLVVLVRRKMLLPTLRQLVAEHALQKPPRKALKKPKTKAKRRASTRR